MKGYFTGVRVNHEVAPTTGTHHLQCTFVLKSKLKHYQFMKFDFMNKDLEVGISGAWAQGCIYPRACWNYCCKEDTRWNNEFFEFGEPPKETRGRGMQGKRSDLDRMFEAVREGASDFDLATTYTKSFGLHHRGIQAVRNACTPESFKVPNRKLVVCIGPSRCGKSHFMLYDCPEGPQGNAADMYLPLHAGAHWFDGYYGQRFAGWHEFSGARSGFTLEGFNQLMDEYPARVEVKGGTVRWTCQNIILCSNYPPWQWWDWTNRGQKYLSVYGRIMVCYVWPGDWKPQYSDDGATILNHVAPQRLVRGSAEWKAFFTERTYKIDDDGFGDDGPRVPDWVNHRSWAKR